MPTSPDSDFQRLLDLLFTMSEPWYWESLAKYDTERRELEAEASRWAGEAYKRNPDRETCLEYAQTERFNSEAIKAEYDKLLATHTEAYKLLWRLLPGSKRLLPRLDNGNAESAAAQVREVHDLVHAKIAEAQGEAAGSWNERYQKYQQRCHKELGLGTPIGSPGLDEDQRWAKHLELQAEYEALMAAPDAPKPVQVTLGLAVVVEGYREHDRLRAEASEFDDDAPECIRLLNEAEYRRRRLMEESPIAKAIEEIDSGIRVGNTFGSEQLNGVVWHDWQRWLKDAKAGQITTVPESGSKSLREKALAVNNLIAAETPPGAANGGKKLDGKRGRKTKYPLRTWKPRYRAWKEENNRSGITQEKWAVQQSLAPDEVVYAFRAVRAADSKSATQTSAQ